MGYLKSILFLFLLSLYSFASDGIINIDEISSNEAKVEKKTNYGFFSYDAMSLLYQDD